LAGREEERVLANAGVRFAGGEGVARNVSASGIYFVTHSVFHIGQAVELELEFPDLPGGALRVTCSGRVVRVQSEGTTWGVAAAIANFAFRRST
jgi:hypothetical protein